MALTGIFRTSSGSLIKQGVKEDAPSFVRNRIAMQDTYMEEIRKSFPDVRAVIPLFDQEVRGLPMLQRTASHLFS